MTSITPRIIITAALLSLAVAVPAASAMPLRDNEGVQTSSLAGTVSPHQDLRGPDARPQTIPPILKVAPTQDLRNPDNQAPRYQGPALKVTPIPVQQSPYTADQLKPPSTPTVATDDDPSPFVYIIPAIVLVALAGTGLAFARTRRHAHGSPA
jgi:hypothetical protein